MGIAVCISCGSMKSKPFEACSHCGFAPGNNLANAQSLLLSDQYYDAEKDERPGVEYLNRMSERIRSKETIEWDESLLQRLVAEQVALDSSRAPSWFKVILLCLLFWTIPIVALVVFLVRGC